ncbi:UDP-N-acetylmuramate--L-alanine ligase [Psychroflexus sp. ALD_RP9]|uniref:UDP-N-acetylmuramate--L-alanine ligase n=1 Tax=Psychroflexus sp. ALD_RP9 TaxID=2777186 RepID=UPI001A8C029D|nr:UDP-N-acetylmuramate--L-alanine ligase [Psychroflexus sp. ALD_RP9]QSS96508.1 UDP-N-acetylmuramate--L-alanine ligase [Psychroflexus sp. ALD_RP9]
MKDLNHYSSIFCIGIGGIGLSAIARYFNHNNAKVFGYDRTATKLTQQLEAEGINIQTSLDTVNLKQFLPEKTLVIYTAAISVQNELLVYFKSQGFDCYKRARVLGEITKNKPTLAVAGTHGKTTTSAILAHLLFQAKINFTGFLGGVVNDFDSNYVSTGSDLFVVEADEFDRSFLQLQPTKACVIAQDPDHLDIYETPEQFNQTFKEFVQLLPNSSQAFLGPKVNLNGINLELNSSGKFALSNVKVVNQAFQFDFKLDEVELKSVRSNLPGLHNCINSALALALAISEFPDKAEVFAKAISTFKGIKRRFNKVIENENLIVIDDYAHHPTEINAVYETLEELYPNKRKMVVFQPHLYSRTRDFITDFILVLKQFNVVALLDIYPARELPIQGVTSKVLAQKIGDHAKVISKKSIYHEIISSQCEVVAMLGAGDIGVEVGHITKQLEANV